jgi:hypothetical protein
MYAVVMGIWESIKAVFADGASTPRDARRLSAVDEFALSACLRVLYDGERGWITLSEARALFSPRDEQYAFGEMDEKGEPISPVLQRAANIDPISILCQLSDGSNSLEERLDSPFSTTSPRRTASTLVTCARSHRIERDFVTD